jgi:mono/diheme cytochrome c family protein
MREPLVSRRAHGNRAALMIAALIAQSVVVTYAAGQAPENAAGGDAARGKTLFERTYRCYACHGFDGQTGTVRLVPMTRSRDAFVAFLRNPPRDAMPKYADVPERDLSDVHAYIRSIPPSKVPSSEIPLLKQLLDRIGKN